MLQKSNIGIYKDSIIDLHGIELSIQDVINARRAYYGNISYIVEEIGEFMDLLNESEIFENT